MGLEKFKARYYTFLIFFYNESRWSGPCLIGSIKELSWTRENHCQFLKWQARVSLLWKWSGHLVKLPPTVIFKLKGVKKDDRKPTNVKIIRFPESNILVTIIQRKFEVNNSFLSSTKTQAVFLTSDWKITCCFTNKTEGEDQLFSTNFSLENRYLFWILFSSHFFCSLPWINTAI